jgi:rRNA maturation protein Rpf1
MFASFSSPPSDSMLVSHLPIGPTAFLKVSSFQPGKKIPGHGRATSHIPELILNNFTTRLGRRTGRFLGSLFPHVSQDVSDRPFDSSQSPLSHSLIRILNLKEDKW